jgi:hypothetical protein
MGPLPVIPDQLLAGIGDMRAKSGEKIEGRTGGSGRRIGTGAAIVVFGIIGDLAVLGVVV